MKKIILNLEKEYLVYLFVLLGIALIIFPDQISAAIPYILGAGAAVYGIVTIIFNIRHPDSASNLGDGIIYTIIGILLFVMENHSITVIGIIWSMESLHKSAEEIDTARKTKHISPFNLISIIISIVLAGLLMADPFKHFSFHVRVLGLEVLVSAFIRRRQSKKEKTGQES